MSTEGPQAQPPRTRAELRALRQAELLMTTEQAQPAVSPPDPEPAEPARDTGQRPRSRFALTLASTLAVLALIVGGLSVYSLTQGPRLTNVQVDPHEAIELSGSRVILTTNQPLAPIDPAQVTVTPETPFTVDARGRSIGVRFTVPLDDDTEYTITVSDVTSLSGGTASELRTVFTTPSIELYLLQRQAGEADDTIFRTGVGGQSAIPLFSHPRIGAFQQTGDHLVVAVEEEGLSRLVVLDDGGEVLHDLELPGPGYVSDLQVSDRGGLVGYLFNDEYLDEFSGRASVLVTQSIANGAPEIVQVVGREVSVVEWRFVPDTSSALFIDFDNTLFVEDRADAASVPVSLGVVLSIQGIERGTYTAILLQQDGELVRRDLAEGGESPFPISRPDFGPPEAIVPFPGGMIQHIVVRDEIGLPLGQLIIRVDDDGAATIALEVGDTDAIMQACTSPSGQYLAVTVAPNMVSNPYDDQIMPMPQRLETHLLELRTGESISVLSGFNVSWCAVGSRW